MPNKQKNHDSRREDGLVSLRQLSHLLDADASAIRRWLREAGIRPLVLGSGRNGAIRFQREEVDAWLRSRARGE